MISENSIATVERAATEQYRNSVTQFWRIAGTLQSMQDSDWNGITFTAEELRWIVMDRELLRYSRTNGKMAQGAVAPRFKVRGKSSKAEKSTKAVNSCNRHADDMDRQIRRSRYHTRLLRAHDSATTKHGKSTMRAKIYALTAMTPNALRDAL